MSVLASALEPLAFDFVSFGFFTFVNNLWTWLALLTAALSFWRIRAAGESSNGSTPPLAEEEHPPPTSSSPAAAPAPVASAVTSRSSEDHEGVVTKGLKFTVYYENDEEEEEGDGELTMTEDLEVDEVEGGDWWESWERVLKMRRGEMGWYRYQDLTEINGNVVRLWDGCRIRPDSCISKTVSIW